MCIRDSRCALTGELGYPNQHNQTGNGDGASDGRAEQFTGAVSYTHLRAHETVLDIVCRLLLEKKTDLASTT